MGLRKRVWHWGDGEITNGISPTHIYKYPGSYQQTYIDYFDDGSESETVVGTEVVSETNSNSQHNRLLSADGSRKCLRMSLNSDESGWSYIDGDRWLWPESSASICTFPKDGVMHKLIWDDNGVAYIYNLRDSTVSSINTVYTDKYSDVTGLESSGYDIPSHILFKEMRGNNSHYKIKHEETFFKIRPEGDSFETDQSIDVTLLVDGASTGISTQYDIDVDREVVFGHKEDGDTFQLKIAFDKSNWELLRYETYSSTTDRARFASNNTTLNTNSQLALSNLNYWLTRGDYTKDRVSGNDVSLTINDYIDGPEGATDSAIYLENSENITGLNIGDRLLFFTTSLFGFSGVGALTQFGATIDGYWILAYADLTSTTLTTPVFVGLHDVRAIDSSSIDANFLDYLQVYYDDITKTDGKRFLPRY